MTCRFPSGYRQLWQRSSRQKFEMGGSTPQRKRHSSAKKHLKNLKCTVHVEIQAITCPGVVLSNQEDVYLSVCVLGQYRKTPPLPPIFPLLFHHNMVFVKTFCGAVDPSDLTDLLEADTTTFELIQLVPPGETLATVEESTREFLYPGPRLMSRAGAPEREILMKRSASFPGISPKLEFATKSVIEECDGRDVQQPSSACCPSPDGAAPSSPSQARPGRRATGRESPERYQQPTVASLSRAPSPYTHRRMCQLSEDAGQRLAHLHLGPHRFRKETEAQTPFLVPFSPSASMVETSPPPTLSSPRHKHNSTAQYTDSSLLGSYRPKASRKSSKQEVPRTSLRGVPPSPAQPAPASAPGRPLVTPGSSSSSSSLRDRVRNNPSCPTHWEEIHRRVQSILLTHGAHRKLPSDAEKGSAQQRLPCSCKDSLCDCQLLQASPQAPPRETSVHLDSGSFWSGQAARYRGKPHRAVFEDSLGKIYSNMYQQASSSN